MDFLNKKVGNIGFNMLEKIMDEIHNNIDPICEVKGKGYIIFHGIDLDGTLWATNYHNNSYDCLVEVKNYTPKQTFTKQDIIDLGLSIKIVQGLLNL